jgi:hypothetical protein
MCFCLLLRGGEGKHSGGMEQVGEFVGGLTAAAVYPEQLVQEDVSESESESERILRTVFHNGG